MEMKRAGFLTKLVVLALLFYLATSLLELRGQIRENESLRDCLSQRVSDVEIENRELADAIEGSEDPAMMEQVARDKGSVRQDETVYIDVAN